MSDTNNKLLVIGTKERRTGLKTTTRANNVNEPSMELLLKRWRTISECQIL